MHGLFRSFILNIIIIRVAVPFNDLYKGDPLEANKTQEICILQ